MAELLLARSARRRLLTLAKANEAWKIAATCWHRLREAGVPPGSADYDVLAMPVVVLYSRPFTECGGLTPLIGYDDFSKAPNPTAFAENHQRMLKARNMLFAHIDIPGSQRLIDGRAGFGRTDFIAVRREPDESFSFETKSLLPDMLGSFGVPTLLAFQLARLGSEMVDTANRLLGKKIEIGRVYRLIDREARKAGLE